jgi:hypothetical protein
MLSVLLLRQCGRDGLPRLELCGQENFADQRVFGEVICSRVNLLYHNILLRHHRSLALAFPKIT